jgi:hypothetical protein
MSITLVNAGNYQHELMEFSINKTLQAVPNVESISVVSNQQIKINSDYRFFRIDESFNMLDYCNFCIKGLDEVVDTEFALITQYDGMATRPQFWTDEFLDYDYIGSLSHVDFPPVKNSLQASNFYDDFKDAHWFTAGGGLSLRSKKLLTILKNDDKIKTVNYKDGCKTPFISEDIVITLLNKEYLQKEYGIKFAPLELGLKFCAEVVTGYPNALGFHGWYNAPLYLSEEECIYFLSHMKRQDFEKNSIQMQMCKHHVMMQGYMKLREFLIEIDKWMIY